MPSSSSFLPASLPPVSTWAAMQREIEKSERRGPSVEDLPEGWWYFCNPAWAPGEKQRRFLADRNDVVLIGGAPGSGKTTAAIWYITRAALERPGLRVVVTKTSMPDLEKSFFADLTAYYEKLNEMWGLGIVVNATKSTVDFGNSSVLLAVSGDGARHFQGMSNDITVVEEGAEVRPDVWEMVIRSRRPSMSSMMNAKVGDGPCLGKLIITANPSAKGENLSSDYLKREFQDVCKKRRLDEKAEGRWFDYGDLGNGTSYYPMSVWDNEELLRRDPGYVDRIRKVMMDLEGYSKEAADALLAGEWASRAGLVLDAVGDECRGDWGWFRNGETVYAGFDYGVNDPTAVVFAAIREGRLYLLGCFREPLKDRSHEWLAGRLEDMARPGVVAWYASDSNMQPARKPGERIVSPWHDMRRAGMPLIQAGGAKKSREERVRSMRMLEAEGRVRFNSDGPGMDQFWWERENWVRAHGDFLPELDARNDHLMEAYGYLCLSVKTMLMGEEIGDGDGGERVPEVREEESPWMKLGLKWDDGGDCGGDEQRVGVRVI